MDERGRRRRAVGKIFAFVGLIHQHRGALEYDWRTRFHLGVDQVGDARLMSWGEAARLLEVLRVDPSSQVHRVVNGWEFAVSREWLLGWEQHWAVVQANFSNAARLKIPRPWDPPQVKHGTASLSVAQLRRILDANNARTPEKSKGAVVTGG